MRCQQQLARPRQQSPVDLALLSSRRSGLHSRILLASRPLRSVCEPYTRGGLRRCLDAPRVVHRVLAAAMVGVSPAGLCSPSHTRRRPSPPTSAAFSTIILPTINQHSSAPYTNTSIRSGQQRPAALPSQRRLFTHLTNAPSRTITRYCCSLLPLLSTPLPPHALPSFSRAACRASRLR